MASFPQIGRCPELRRGGRAALEAPSAGTYRARSRSSCPLGRGTRTGEYTGSLLSRAESPRGRIAFGVVMEDWVNVGPA